MNRGEIRQAMLDELSKTSNDSFHTTAILNRFINRAVRFVAKYKNWEQTQKAEKFPVTQVGDDTDEYFDYPETFVSDSIYRVAVGDGTLSGDERYTLLIWDEYLNHREDNDNDDKIASDHRRQVFISPVVATDKYVSIWGHELPQDMDDDTDEHPFVDDPEIEEAIISYAMALAFKKMRGSYFTEGKARQADSISVLDAAWKEQRSKQAERRTKDAEAWEYTDFMNISGQGRITRRGNFTLE